MADEADVAALEAALAKDTGLWLSLAQTARLMKINERTVRRWIARDRFPVAFIREPGGRYRFRATDISRYLRGDDNQVAV
jgi:excisionase family DNA binding protein